jgi:alkylated DNA repair dioxygenase AlkB
MLKMRCRHNLDPLQSMQVLMDAGDLIMLHGVARYEWRHGIPASSHDTWKDGVVKQRSERTSLTFRAMHKWATE